MKNIDKKQLKIISMEFRTIANRLITCNHQTGMALLKKFMAYIDENEIISEYIKQYVNPEGLASPQWEIQNKRKSLIHISI